MNMLLIKSLKLNTNIDYLVERFADILLKNDYV